MTRSVTLMTTTVVLPEVEGVEPQHTIVQNKVKVCTDQQPCDHREDREKRARKTIQRKLRDALAKGLIFQILLELGKVVLHFNADVLLVGNLHLSRRDHRILGNFVWIAVN